MKTAHNFTKNAIHISDLYAFFTGAAIKLQQATWVSMCFPTKAYKRFEIAFSISPSTRSWYSCKHRHRTATAWHVPKWNVFSKQPKLQARIEKPHMTCKRGQKSRKLECTSSIVHREALCLRGLPAPALAVKSEESSGFQAPPSLLRDISFGFLDQSVRGNKLLHWQ